MKPSGWLACILALLTLLAIGSSSASAQSFYVSLFGARNDTSGNIVTATAGGSVNPLVSGIDGSDVMFLTINSSGTLYESSVGAGGLNSAVNIISNTGVVTPFYTYGGSYDIGGLAFDGAGNLYVTNPSGDQAVDKITPGGSESMFSSALSTSLNGLVYSGGFLYATTYFDNTIYKIDASNGSSSVFSTINDNLTGIISDGSGGFYVTDVEGTIFQVDSSGTATPFVIIPGGVLWQLTMDSSGNLWVADAGNGSIDMVTPGGIVTMPITGLDHPGGIVLIPEPGSWALLIAAGGMLGLTFWRKMLV